MTTHEKQILGKTGLKMVKRLFVLLAAVFIINSLLLQFLDRSFGWGNEDLIQKLNDLKQNHSGVNTVFIGSSKTYRAIVPDLFDSLVQTKRHSIRSYNLGIPSMFSVESFNLIDHLLDETELDLQYLFIELNGAQLGPGMVHIPRGKYFLNGSQYRFAVMALLNSHYSTEGKLVNIKYYSLNFIERLSMYGLLRANWQSRQIEDQALPSTILQANRGFLSYEREISISGDSERIRLGKKHVKLLRDTAIIQKKLALDHKQDPKPNPVHLKAIEKLINRAEKRGIRLVFYRMPAQKLYNSHLEAQGLLSGLGVAHKIDLADRNRYPELFLAKHLYNAEHMNEQGARIFTRNLAYAFNDLPQ